MHNMDVHKDGIYKGFTASYPELYESYQGTPMNVTGMGQEPWEMEGPTFELDGWKTQDVKLHEISYTPHDWPSKDPVSERLLGTRDILTTFLQEGTGIAKQIIQGQYAAQAAEDRLELQKIQFEQAAKIRELQMSGRVASGRMPGEMPTWAVPAAVGVLGVLLLARFM